MKFQIISLIGKRKRLLLALFLSIITFLFIHLFYMYRTCFFYTGPLAGKVIVLDPGHGGIDSGCHVDDLMEKNMNLMIAKELKKELSKLGAKVILTRNKDMSLDHMNHYSSSRQRRDLYARVSIIEKYQPDIFLSIHINSNEHIPNMTGTFVYYHQWVHNADIMASHLQQRFDTLMVKYGFQKHKPLHGDFFILNNTTYTGVLVELGFISNPEERKLLINPLYQDELVMHMVEGLLDYFSHIDTP
ncbi:MAG: N-acetylmuramoyl-L-alanine amidase family protein [Bacillota bacterium]